MTDIHVNTAKPYDIHIQKGLLEDAGSYTKSLTAAKKTMIITDSNVAPLYLKTVSDSIKAAQIQTESFIYEAGEQSKTLNTVSMIYDALSRFRMSRKDIIIALGGGVCGDMAGFAAATYLRGIDFIQIPTSLLSQVDSSVGGKTGVNITEGKNLVGAFHQPKAVLIDPFTLKTLKIQQIADGMGEIIKYGCISDSQFFNFLEQNDAMSNIEHVIRTCITIKRDIVSRDEFESGERMLLNFGHTLGHAIEKLSGYKDITHGMAVGLGMIMITKASEKQGFTKKGCAQKISDLCKKYGIPTQCRYTFSELADAAKTDKKSTGSSINLVLLKDIGRSFIHNIKTDSLEEFITV